MAPQQQTKSKGPDLKALGLKSGREVFDILALLRIEGEPVIKNERDLLDPKNKARAVFEFFTQNFDMDPDTLPYLAAVIKRDLKSGRLEWRK